MVSSGDNVDFCSHSFAYDSAMISLLVYRAARTTKTLGCELNINGCRGTFLQNRKFSLFFDSILLSFYGYLHSVLTFLYCKILYIKHEFTIMRGLAFHIFFIILLEPVHRNIVKPYPVPIHPLCNKASH